MSIVINGTKTETSTAIEYVENPKRVGKLAWTRYESYSAATTIGEYLQLAEKKYAMADLRYDMDHGFLSIVEDDDQLAEALDVLHAE